MEESILTTVIHLHFAALCERAANWLDSEVAALSITDLAGAVIAQWPLASPICHSALSAPIQLHGHCLGRLHIAGKVNTLVERSLVTEAKLFSTLIELEYELERMTTDIIDQQDQLMALHQLAQTTRVYNDMRQNLSDLARITAQLLKAEDAFMVLQTDGQAPLLVSYPRKEWPQAMWHGLLHGLEGAPDKTQWLLHQHDPLLHKFAVPIRNLLVKKMTVRPGISLLLGAANKIVGDFQAPDLKLFSTIAEPAGANLENAILHQEILDQTRIQTEMALAAQVQTHLLPQSTPKIPGVELAAQSCPTFHVGGDFYDFITGHGHLLTFTLGDVSGKGMPAALLMAMLNTVLRGKAKEMTSAAPETLLNIANEWLYNDFSEVNMFATVFIGQYDYENHLLYYANDGHAPVIYRPAAGSAVLLPADAPPLGVLPTSLAERQTIAFQPGDLLVIASDGFSEAERSNEEMFGYERLLQLVDQLAALPAIHLMQDMFTVVQNFSGDRPQSDDQTLLILRRTEGNGRSS